MKGKKIIIAGGSGFMGQAMKAYFGSDNEVLILSRNSNTRPYIHWDGKTIEYSWLQELNGADIVINLSGKSVNCRYTEKNKQAIIDSRVHSTKAIGEAIRQTVVPPKLWINASSATIYRNAYSGPQDEFTGEINNLRTENIPHTFLDSLRFRNKTLRDFSVKVCKLWEEAFFTRRTPFTRKVALRTAVTLGADGVMPRYLNLCKAGMGGRHGSGKQMYSWVHIEDVCRMIEWLWENKELEGVFNCAAPNPVTNEQFMWMLRKATGHRFGLPAPVWMLECGALMIGTETELMLKSRWVVPTRALQEGFTFKYDTLGKAFAQIVGAMPRRKYHLF